MKPIESLRGEVTKNFERMLSDTTDMYLINFEEKVSNAIFLGYKDDPELTVNTKVRSITNADVTSLMEKLLKERPDIRKEVFKRVSVAGYKIEKITHLEEFFDNFGNTIERTKSSTYTLQF